MKTAYIHANVLDGTENMSVQENMTIVVENDKIVSIDKDGKSVLSDAKVVDLRGKYLMPGLINLHVHLPGGGNPSQRKSQTKDSVKKLMGSSLSRYIVKSMCAGYAKTQLLSGTTTIRTVGGLGHIDTDIRDEINAGKRQGPRILASNLAISVPGGHMAGVLAYEAESKEDCIKYVDIIAKDKPDIIKLMITGGVLDATVKGEPGVLRMHPELVKAACEEAHKLGFKVAAHVESPTGVKIALENGVDSIEHGALLDDEIVSTFKKTGAVDICTLSPAIPLAKLPPEVTHSNELTQFNGQVVLDGITGAAKRCLKEGITVGLGTDTACPFVTHYDTWRELVYFVKLVGVTPNFALHTATLKNAKIAGIDNVTGSVTVGKSADFLIAESNPLNDLTTLRKPYMVVFRGKAIKQPKIKKFDLVEKELDSFLAKI